MSYLRRLRGKVMMWPTKWWELRQTQALRKMAQGLISNKVCHLYTTPWMVTHLKISKIHSSISLNGCICLLGCCLDQMVDLSWCKKMDHIPLQRWCVRPSPKRSDLQVQALHLNHPPLTTQTQTQRGDRGKERRRKIAAGLQIQRRLKKQQQIRSSKRLQLAPMARIRPIRQVFHLYSHHRVQLLPYQMHLHQHQRPQSALTHPILNQLHHQPSSNHPPLKLNNQSLSLPLP